jgi:translation initiation factor IF-2
LAKRVFEIAKELGIVSKAIVEKCHAEGIPEEVIRNHMSTVSVGLEATIREWFTAHDSTVTAVEQSEKVDIDKVRDPARGKARKAKAAGAAAAGDESGESAGTAVAEPPAKARPAAAPDAGAAHAGGGVGAAGGGATGGGAAGGVARAATRPSGIGAPTAAGTSAAGAPGTTGTGTGGRAGPAVTLETPTAIEPAAVGPVAGGPVAGGPVAVGPVAGGPAAGGVAAGGMAATAAAVPGAPARPAQPRATSMPAGLSMKPPEATPVPVVRPMPGDRRPEGDRGGGPGGGPRVGRGEDGPSGPRRVEVGKPTLPEKPAPMNVPTRPKVVTPAGPRIEEIEKNRIKLSGPKVVRVEAAEVVEAPRPRGPRPGGPGVGGPGGPGGGPGFGGGGQGGPGGAGRRNDRRRTETGVPDRRRGRAGAATGEAPAGGWTNADLAEREARLQRSGGFLKARRQQQLRPGVGATAQSAAARGGGKVEIAAPFTIKDLSAATGVKGADIVKKLFMSGVMATINSGIEPEKAQEVMLEFDIDLEVTTARTAEEKVSDQFIKRDMVEERARGPVVTILGHVDHGKTSLLDRIRNANVAAGEAGGITQATSAFRTPVKLGDEEKFIVFIDTPGHEAFTAMRARGARVTDIVVLVVAADDGVMPQTKESISHAQAAGVPIIVALNKIDKAEATESNIQRILGQLAEQGLNPVEWGGQTEVVRVSATKGIGIQALLEILDLQSQLLELKSDFGGAAQGSVIESRPEPGRGNVANILVQNGKLSVGDFIVMGRAFGRVRDITDDRGNRVKVATPPMPVQISGIDELPDAGDKFYCVPSLKEAEQAAKQRRDRERQEQLAQPKMTLDRMFTQIAEQSLKEILVVLKADVQGSVDVLRHEVEKVGTEEIKVRVIHAAVGGITESDILLADASRAVIIGFNVIASGKGRSLAEQKGVEIRNYQVIYDIVDDLKKAAEGMLAPELRQEVLGHAEVRQVFKISKVGWIAGCYVTDGTIERDASVRVTRAGVVIENDRRLEQLKRFKDDAKEVRAGMECGMKIVGYDDIKAGDVLECYKQVEVKRTL